MEDRDKSDLELIAEAIVAGIDWTDKIINDTDKAYEALFLGGDLNDAARRWLEGEGPCRFAQHERRAVLMQTAIVHREKLLDGGMDSVRANIMMRAMLSLIIAGEMARDELFKLRLEVMNREESVVTMN